MRSYRSITETIGARIGIRSKLLWAALLCTIALCALSTQSVYAAGTIFVKPDGNNNGFVDGGGNLSTDPLFVDAAHGNLRLTADSPAIDAGTNSANPLATDLDANPRKLDGDGDQNVVVDMGAYEFELFAPLTVTVAGDGKGKVDFTPAGTPCSAPCVGVYAAGTSVVLTATAAPTSTFSGWNGACSGIAPCNLTIGASNTVTALFGLNSYTLTVVKGGDGDGTIGKTPDQPAYAYGSVVTLTASAFVSSTFDGWSNNCTTPTPAQCVVTIDAGKSVTSLFHLNAYSVTTATVGEGTGVISKTPDLPAYTYGTVVTLTAVANPGSFFSGWSGDCSGVATPCRRTIGLTNAVTATFSREVYTVTIHTVGNGSVVKQPNQPTFFYGTVITLTPSADPGATFDGWSGDCPGAGNPLAVCHLTVDGNKEVTATFVVAGAVGNVRGHVRDQDHKSIAGATMTLTPVTANTADAATIAATPAFTQTTNANGDYQFSAIPVGSYRLNATALYADPITPRPVVIKGGITVTAHDITLHFQTTFMQLPLIRRGK